MHNDCEYVNVLITMTEDAILQINKKKSKYLNVLCTMTEYDTCNDYRDDFGEICKLYIAILYGTLNIYFVYSTLNIHYTQ